MDSKKYTGKGSSLPDGGRASSLMMALEPRIMFDGAAAATLDHAIDPSSAPKEAASAAAREASQAGPVATAMAQASAPLAAQPDGASQAARAPAAFINTASAATANAPALVSASLAAAEADALKAISDFLQSPSAREQLFATFNGGQTVASPAWQQSADALLAAFGAGDAAVRVELRSNAEMRGALGAFAAVSPDGKPVIYLNADWIRTGAPVAELSRVLVEEFGHSIDASLNGASDTRGDEGDVFAARLLGETRAGTLREQLDDHATLRLDGVDVAVEEASATFRAVYRGIPSAWSLQASNITLNSQLDAVAGTIKFISADPSAAFFSGNNVAGNLVYTDSAGVVHSISGVVSRQFKTGGTTNAFYFYSVGANGLVDGSDDAAYLIQVAADSSSYVFDGSGAAQYRTSSDPVSSALNAILDTGVPTLTAATSASSGAVAALEAGGSSNGTAGHDGTGNVLDASLASGSGLSVQSVGVGAASQSAVGAATTSANGTSVAGSFGTLTLGANGTYRYLVNDSNASVQALRQASDTLSDTFNYTVKDSGGKIASTTLTVTIQGQNDKPAALNDYGTAKATLSSVASGSQYTSSDPYGSKASGNVLSNDSDVDRNGETKTIVGVIATATFSSYTAGGATSTLAFAAGNGFSAISVGDYVYTPKIANKYYLLLSSSGANITITSKVVNADGTYAIGLSATPSKYNTGSSDVGYTLSNGATVDFASTASNNDNNVPGIKEATIATTTATQSSTLSVAVTDGVVAVGMTVSGTNVPTGAKVTAVATVNGTTTVTLDKSFTSAPSGTISFLGAGGVTLNGSYGSLVLNADGGYTYTPTADTAGGTDSFKYSMQDAGGLTSSATLSIAVLASTSSDPNAFADAVGGTEAAVSAGTNPAGNVLTGTISSGTGSASTADAAGSGATFGSYPVIAARTAAASSSTAIAASSGSYQDFAGNFGTLRLYSSGAYSYTIDNSNSEVNALNSGSSLSDVFYYTVTNSLSKSDTAALTITINGANDAAELDLDPVNTGSLNFVSTFNQSDGLAVPLASLSGAHLADADNSSYAKLTLAYNQANFADGASEQLLISGATGSNPSISNLGGLANGANGSFTLAGVNYTYAVAVSGASATISFTPASAISLANAETLLAALHYKDTAATPTANSSRVISISMFDAGNLSSNTATTTLTVYGTSSAPIATADTDSATEAGGTANGSAGVDPAGNVISGAAVGDSGSGITVTLAKAGASVAGGTAVAASSTSASNATSIVGSYGTLAIGADGSYQYTVDNSNATVQALQQGGATLSDTFSYRITDDASQTSSATLIITVHGANDAPTVVSAPVNQTATVGSAFSYTVPAFADVDTGDTITYGASGSLPAGISFNAATRTFSGTASATLAAQTITITGTDSLGATVSTSFTLSAANPVVTAATADTASATEAGGTGNATAGSDPSGNVKSNDSGTGITVTLAKAGASVAGGTAVAASSTSLSNATSIAGSYGTLALGADGSYQYTVNNSLAAVQALQQGGATLSDTFSYQITDAVSATAATTLTVTIHGANDAPTVASAPANQIATVGTAFSYTVPAFADVDTGDTISYGASGTLPAGISFDAATRTFSGTPSATEAVQTITVTGTDSLGATVSTSFTLGAVAAGVSVATADTATADEAGGTGNATAGTDPTGNVKSNDAGTGITVTLVKAGASVVGGTAVAASSTSASDATSIAGDYGTLTIGADGSYQYTVDNGNPAVQALQQGGATLSDTFSYQLTDASSGTAATTLTVTIHGANDAPTVASAPVNQSATVGSAFSYTVPAFADVDAGDTISYGASGTLPDGISFDAATRSFSGTASAAQAAQTITVTGTDSLGATVSTSFTLAAVNPAAPAMTADTASATEAGGSANATPGTDPSGNVKSNDSGSGITVTLAKAGASVAGGTAVAASSTSASNATSIAGSYGTLALGADGSYHYTVDNSNAAVQALQQGGATLSDTFSYQVTDVAGQSASTTLTVTVHGANDAPSVASAPVDQSATVGTAFSYTVPAFADADADDTISYAASGTLPAGISFNAATRTFSGTASATQAAQTITITGTDSLGATVSTSFTLAAVNPGAPVATADTASATEAGGTANGAAGSDPSGNVRSNDSGTGITVTLAKAGASVAGGAAVAAGSTAASNATSIAGSYGTLSMGADGSYHYTVDNSNAAVQALQQGGATLSDTFSYQITDAGSTTAASTLTVTIHGADDAPTVASAPVNQSAAVGTPFSYTVPAFADVDTGDTISYAVSGSLPPGISFDPATRTFSGTPSAMLAAQTITITGTDSLGATVSTSFTLGATGPGPSGATPDTATALEAGGTGNATAGSDPSGNVRSNDSGTGITVTLAKAGASVAGGTVVAASSTSLSNATSIAGSYGTLALGADGSYKYTVNNSHAAVQALQQGGATLSDTFSYQITDAVSATAATTLTVTISGANDAPTVASAPLNQNATVGAAFSYTVPAFADVDTGDTISYAASGSLPAGISFNPATRTFSGTPSAAQAAQTIIVTGTDSRGASVATSFTLAAELLPAPAITISSEASTLSAGESAVLHFQLSAVPGSNGFDAGDVTVSGGSLSGFSGSGTSYSALFTPYADSGSDGVISVAGGRFNDSYGTASTASNSVTLTVDTLRPTVTIASDKSVLKADETATLTFSLSESPGSDPFELADVSVSGGRLSEFSGSGTSYTATFTPDQNSNASAVVSVDGVRFNDSHGNGNMSSNTVLMVVDSIVPTIEVGSDKSALKVGETALISFTLSETPGSDPFEAGDVSVSGGSLSGFSGSGGSYSAIFTPAANSSAPAVISVGGSRFNDAAGNPSRPSNLVNLVVDTVIPPAPALALVNDTGESQSDRISRDGTLRLSGVLAGASVAYSTDGVHWSAGFTPVEGSNTVLVRQTSVGGNVSPSSAPYVFTLDRTIAVPVIGLSRDSGKPDDAISNDAGLTISAAASDVRRTVQVDGGAPQADYLAPGTDGVHTVTVSDLDIAGNTSTASIRYTLDRSGPVLSLTAGAGAISSANASLGGTAADALSGIGSLTVVLSNGSVSRTFSAAVVDGAWSVDVTELGEGDWSISLSGVDGAGNATTAPGGTLHVEFPKPPAPAVTPPAASPAAVVSVPAADPVLAQATPAAAPAAPALAPSVPVSVPDAALTGTPPRASESLPAGDSALVANVVSGEGAPGEAKLLVANPPQTMVTEIGKESSVQLPAGVFKNTDPNARIAIEATTADNRPLPDWLKFDPKTGKFTGVAPADSQGAVDIKVVAKDELGNTADVQFQIVVASSVSREGGPAAAASEPAAQGSALVTLVSRADAPPGLTLFVAEPPPPSEVGVGKDINYQLPSGVYRHTDPSEVTTTRAMLADGRPLPAWLKYDPGSGKFSGEAPAGAVGDLEISIVAQDKSGREATVKLKIKVVDSSDAAALPGQKGADHPGPDGLPSAHLAATGRALADKPPVAAKASLSRQFGQYGRAASEAERSRLMRNLEQLHEKAEAGKKAA